MAAFSNPLALPGLPLLEQTPILIEKMLSAANDEQMQWKPAADRWSISEVLAHLADVEQVVFRKRIQMMLDSENPALENYDQSAAYAAGKYSGGKPRERLRSFCHERDRNLSWLRYVPPAMISRTGRHSEQGKVTIGNILNAWASHDLGHVRQIAELYRAAAFYPAMGPFQRYHMLKP
jgi:hypothetical protein